jgi:hypothetical protein
VVEGGATVVLQQEAMWKQSGRGSLSADRRVGALYPDAALGGPLRASMSAAALGPLLPLVQTRLTTAFSSKHNHWLFTHL